MFLKAVNVQGSDTTMLNSNTKACHIQNTNNTNTSPNNLRKNLIKFPLQGARGLQTHAPLPGNKIILI